MIKLHGYSSAWLGPSRGILILSPSGQLFHVQAGNVEELTGTFNDQHKHLAAPLIYDRAWRDLPATPELQACYTSLPWPCPSTRGAASEFLMYLLARQLIWTKERWTPEKIPQDRWNRLTPDEQQTMLKGLEFSVITAKTVSQNNDATDFENMTNDQLIAYMQANPDQVRKGP